MKIRKLSALLILTTIFISCNKDDDGGETTVDLRDPQEVSEENDAEIVAFLETHFYNYEEFENPPADFDYKIVIDTIAGDNAGKTPMIDQVEVQSLEHAPDPDEAAVTHKLYTLTARQGVIDETLTVADSALVRYEGNLLSGDVFDSREVPTWQNLPSLVRGYYTGVVKLKRGTGFVENSDGSVTFNNDYGVGLIIMPSGLAYFGAARSGIPSYSPIIFKIDMLGMRLEVDHDQDGIPSYLEDLNNNQYLFDDNTDLAWELKNGYSVNNGVANFVDTDDDADGTLTKNEYDIKNNVTGEFEPDGIPDDTDGDGIPDYLDND
ncbi:hypothetical protein SAMN04487906_1333 [Zhouia amylolytica]|uniref:peptidylprolyl isomerase n=2 Tax=Zhouia amylolytica TaxID=376730 RepID=W2UP85_9FLAO|nr:hypothetical protein [Zhouia amylolytica]ETN95162.1 hypothetical protein P278_19170 [Zhouia amylolytica AD3]MCQ0111879.1 hypothetical protein [Zhouia amylolytica]SFS68199.1 hypothetical protein SAMN04487906_1333 [Zhouia amylolytica]